MDGMNVLGNDAMVSCIFICFFVAAVAAAAAAAAACNYFLFVK